MSLALTPTSLIGVNENLKVPKSLSIISQAKPSLYKYPDFIKKEEGKEKEKVETAVLSTTAKVKARAGRKQKEGGVSETPKAPEEEKKGDVEMTEEKKEEAPPVVVEPDFQELKNPSRVLKAQEKKIQYKGDGRWYPVLDNRYSGFVVLIDQTPDS